MTKKPENILGLAPLPKPESRFGAGNGLVPVPPNRQLSKAEQRTIATLQREKLVIDATTAKTAFGETKIGELHRHTAQEFDETVGFILAIKQEPRSAEHQAYIDAFSIRQIQMLAGHLSGALDIGATNIGLEVQRSLHFDEEAEPVSFFARLFGGRNG